MNVSAIRSDRSDKTIGTARGSLVFQCERSDTLSEADIAEMVGRLEQAVDTSVIHREGSVQVQRNEKYLRLSCVATYGPVFGACKDDLKKLLHRFAKAIQVTATSCDATVLNYSRKENTREELEAHISEMEKRVKDLDTPLAICDRLSGEITRLRGVLS